MQNTNNIPSNINEAQQRVIDEQNRIIQEQSKIIDAKVNEAERYRKIANGHLKDSLTPEEIENVYATTHAKRRLKYLNIWYIIIDALWGFQIFTTILSGKTFNGAWSGLMMLVTIIFIILGIVKMIKSNLVARKCIKDWHITMSKSICESIRLTLILCASSFLSFVALMMLEITLF